MRTTKKKPIRQCQCRTCKNAPRSAEAKEHQAINQVISLLHEKGRRQFAGLLANKTTACGSESPEKVLP
jgi:hypothetical protein